MPGLLLTEPIPDAFCGDLTHIVNGGQIFHGGIHQCIQRTKGACQDFSCFHAHLTNAQGIDQAAYILRFALLYGSQQLFGRSGAGFPKTAHIFQCQIVNICRRMDQFLLDQALHDGTAQALNVHGIPAGKVGNVPAQLSRTLCTGTAQEGSIFVLFHLSPTDRAVIRQEIRCCIFRAFGEIHFQNFRDDLPCLADQDGVTDTDIPLSDKILIVQRGVGHCGTGQTNRAHHSLGGQHTGTPHLYHNILHHRGLDLRRILVSGCPPGEFRSGTQALPQRQVIHLDNGAVDIADQLVPVLVDRCHFFINFPSLAQCFVGNNLKFMLFQILQCLCMGGKLLSLDQLDIENIDIQSPLGGHLRIQLPQRTGSGISGVGKQGLSLFLLPSIQLFKAFLRHEYLAPDDQSGRRILNGHGNGADGLQIFRHILSHISVSPGCSPDENAVYILQRYRKTVDLRLHREIGMPSRSLDLLEKFVQFLHAEHILQAHQGHRMGHFRKLMQCLTAHMLGGGIGLSIFRMGCFQLLQLPQQTVILKILHGGIIQDIIAIICLLEGGSQGFNSLFEIHNFLLFVKTSGVPPRRSPFPLPPPDWLQGSFRFLPAPGQPHPR